MSIGTRAKRVIYLIHRWTGLAACLLMALWFVSGVVMLFVGYPKLTPWERLGALPALGAEKCCVALDTALAHSRAPASVREIVLTSIRNHPYYRLLEGAGGYVVVDAITGKLADPVDMRAALAGARAFLADTDGEYIGVVHEDRWTHARALDPHRPLHAVRMNDPAHTLLYLSSSTGQVVLDAPRAQRLWSYAGAWLHWLYMLRDRPVDPVWRAIVIALSAMGTVAALTGTLAGIWRWRFGRPYKCGARTPYRAPYLRWHHMTGLMFAAVAFTWIFSGLMSMNPFGVFDPKGARPDIAAYRGGDPGAVRPPLEASQALALFRTAHFEPGEIEWRVIGGRPYLLARDGADATRLLVRSGNAFEVREQWADADLLAAAGALLRAPLASHRRLESYDVYYYARQPEAMAGGAERRLPALCVRFADAHDTWAYIDASTGDMALGLDRAQRAGRWLFNFLHSWDLPALLRSGPWRDAALFSLSLGGLALSVTGIVIGCARMRVCAAKVRRRAA